MRGKVTEGRRGGVDGVFEIQLEFNKLTERGFADLRFHNLL